MTERAITLLRDHVTTPDYPGIVLAYGGDMTTGAEEIMHNELAANSDVLSIDAILECYDAMHAQVTALAKEFRRVFIPCATGNHGRLTKKSWTKGRSGTNTDFLLYAMLARNFAKDRRVEFLLPAGHDVRYKVFDHRYLLTHGDKLGTSGGDGIIGALGPIMRGDAKKRARNGNIGAAYDTMLIGHYHQYIFMPGRVIVNGCLVGHDEYAESMGFAVRAPEQGLWMTHPEHGITISMPVKIDAGLDLACKEGSDWISWAK